jgi:hypothetical protein
MPFSSLCSGEKDLEVVIFTQLGSSRLPKHRRILENVYCCPSLACSQIWLFPLLDGWLPVVFFFGEFSQPGDKKKRAGESNKGIFEILKKNRHILTKKM